MFNDLIKSIRAQLYERAISPLFGSIALSWCLWNFKFILLIFSGIPVEEKYRIINEVLYSSWQQQYLYGALIPLLTALLYIYIYPYPAKKVFEFSRNRQKEMSDIKRKIDDETLLTVKESRSIKGEIYKLEEEFQKDIQRKNEEIKRLNFEISDLKKHAKFDKEPLIKKPQKGKLNNIELSPEQISLLRVIGKNPDFSENNIYRYSREKFGHGNIETKFNLGDLVKRGYLDNPVYDETLETDIYEISHKGREYLVKNNHLDNKIAFFEK